MKKVISRMGRRGLLVLLGTVAVSSLGLAQLPWNEFYRWSTGDFCRRGQFCGHGRQRNSDTHQRYERFPYSGPMSSVLLGPSGDGLRFAPPAFLVRDFIFSW